MEVMWNMQSSSIYFKVVVCVTPCEVILCVIAGAVCYLPENSRIERQVHILFHQTFKTATENYKVLKRHWFYKFRSGETSVNDAEYLGCPSMSRKGKNISFSWKRTCQSL
jgi:hypothetical protein